jgi:hypothetical protein
MVGEKLGFDTLSNHNWVFRLELKINSNGRGKLGFETLSTRNWVAGPGLKINSNGQGKIVI